jgi:hypothetical protein
MKYLQE